MMFVSTKLIYMPLMPFANAPTIRQLPRGLPADRQWMLLEWLHTLGHVEDEQELQKFLRAMQQQLPTEHMVLALGRLNTEQHLQKLEKLINISYPEHWLELYVRANFANCDPVLHHPMGLEPIYWKTVFSNSKNPQAKRFIAEAAAFGLGDGISFSAASPRQNTACMISVTGDEIYSDPQMVEMLNTLVPHVQHAMLRVVHLAPMSSSAMLLSNREYDIFHWMSRGKTNWEIATILDISERTVKFHVANIIRKLNANNRTHAIVLGLQQGLKAPSAASE